MKALSERILPTACSTILLLLLLSCGNNIEPVTTTRWIYLPVTTIYGADPAEAGVYRISPNGRRQERITGASVTYLTSVAENGIILMEYDDTLSQRLWGRCEDGQVIPVPFPQTQKSGWKYDYVVPTGITLNRAGHRAVYRASFGPVTPSDPTRAVHQIIYFDCAKWEMTIIDVQDAVKQNMELFGAEFGFVGPTFSFVDKEGESLLFELRGMIDQNGPMEVARQILRWEAGTFSAVTQPEPPGREGFVEFHGYNRATKRLILSRSNGAEHILYARDMDSGAEYNLNIPLSRMSHRLQIADSKAEMAVRGTAGIEIRDLNDGALVRLCITYSEIDRLSRAHHVSTDFPLSLSPDGEWLAFGLIAKANEQPHTYDLFVVRRDGSGARKLGERWHMSVPSISNDLSH